MKMIYNTDRERFRKYAEPEEFDRIVEYGSVTEMWKSILPGVCRNTAIAGDAQT